MADLPENVQNILAREYDRNEREILQVYKKALKATRQRSVLCVHCRRRFTIKEPDFRWAFASAQDWLVAKFGKPATQQAAPQAQVRQGVALEEMTDEELAVIAAGGWPGEEAAAEVSPLPAALQGLTDTSLDTTGGTVVS